MCVCGEGGGDWSGRGGRGRGRNAGGGGGVKECDGMPSTRDPAPLPDPPPLFSIPETLGAAGRVSIFSVLILSHYLNPILVPI